MDVIRTWMSSPLLPFLPANALSRCGVEAVMEVPRAGVGLSSAEARDCIRK
jgi:hypothetical protein